MKNETCMRQTSSSIPASSSNSASRKSNNEKQKNNNSHKRPIGKENSIAGAEAAIDNAFAMKPNNNGTKKARVDRKVSGYNLYQKGLRSYDKKWSDLPELEKQKWHDKATKTNSKKGQPSLKSFFSS